MIVEITLISRWEDLEAISREWNEVLANGAEDTFFLTWEWISAWWNHYGNGRQLFVLLAKKQGKLVGIAPFYVDEVKKYGKRWKALKIIGDGSGDSDYQDCIVLGGLEEEIAQAFVAFLADRRNEWHVMEFESVPETSPFIKAFLNAAKKTFNGMAHEAVPCTFIALPSRWDEYLNLLKPRVRSKVRSSLAFLDKEIHSVPVACSEPKELDEWLPILFDLHTRRWQQAGQSGVFHGSAKQKFYAEVSRSALEKGWLAFYRLDWGERPLAMQYGFLYGDRFLLLQEGYDPGFENVRPGQTLRAWTIRQWIENGLKEYDFLVGAPKHKLEWGGTTKQSLRVRVTSNPASAWAFIDSQKLIETVKEAIRPVIPERLARWRRDTLLARTRKSTTDGARKSPSLNAGHILRQGIVHAYSTTPIGSFGKYVASKYTSESSNGAAEARATRVRKRSEPTCQILIYHRVNDDRDPFLGASRVDAFRQQMEFIAKHFPIVGLDDIASGGWRNREEKFCVALTFDDGYRDNYLNAFPILKDLNIPATIFLTTGCVQDGKLPWYDQVALAFKLTARKSLDWDQYAAPRGAMESTEARIHKMQRTLEWLWALSTEDRVQRLPELFEVLHVSEKPNLPNFMLNWTEIREMSKNGMTFGAHTVTHPVLSHCKMEDVETEIVDSKKTIERNLRKPVNHFAYPFGRYGDFNQDAKRTLRATGFQTAVTTIPGYNRTSDDLLELKRFTPWGQDLGSFALQMDWRRFRGFSQKEQHVTGLFGRTERKSQPAHNAVAEVNRDVG
jgi:peptidoglycan/xylan/chitin deacetylase (PgdA/CDA1 family)/CelD/BcsL family acetyltransferase involved in cellulose biosynthesis